MRVESPEAVRDNRVDQEIDLGGVGRAISAKRMWIVVPTVLALVGSAAFVNIVKPRYTAEARLLLETQDAFIPRADKSPETMPQTLDPEAVGSQVQLIQSRDLARRAIKQIGLLGNAEFDPLAGGVGALSRLMVLAGLKRDPTQLSPEDRVLESYFEKLTVFSPTKTRILNIEFSSKDPDLAAKGANTIADIYLDFQQEAKRNVARAAAASLGNLVSDLKTRVADAEAKAEEFRIQSGLLIGANNTTINTQQLGEVSTELSRARTGQADAQAKAKLIREMIRSGRINEIPDVANNELVRRISEQRVSLKAQLALEARTLLSGHPRIKELSAQLADLDSELRTAAEKTARTLENDARIAGARVENLVAALDQQKKVVGSSGSDEVRMRELDRSARQLKDELETATVKYQEALARESSKATPADARIVSRALAPQIPAFPKKIPIISFATVAALLLSIAAIVAKHLLTDRPAPGGRAAPLPVEVEGVTAQQPQPANDVGEAEADAPARLDLVTSFAIAAPAKGLARQIVDGPARGLALIVCDGDDDNGFAIAVARALAREGRAILVALDAAARMPMPERAGLSDLVAGRATFHQTIHRDGASRLHVLGAGSGPSVDASALWTTLDALKEAYDFVVVAASRTIDVEEAHALAHVADFAAVHGGDAHSAMLLAAALEQSGLPQPVLVGGAEAEMDQSAA